MDLAEFALKKTLNSVPYDKVLIFTNKNLNLDFVGKENCTKCYNIPDKFNVIDWNIFIAKHLVDYVETDHCIIIQPDGFAVNKQYWRDSYLNYDFIGSPTCIHNPKVYLSFKVLGLQEDEYNCSSVFNGAGGFTMRSKKFLLAAKNFDVGENGNFSEDFLLAVRHRKKLISEYDIKFADLDTSFLFSQEDIDLGGHTLGFHGIHNIPCYLNEIDCVPYIDSLKINNSNKITMVMKLASNLKMRNYKDADCLLSQKIASHF